MAYWPQLFESHEWSVDDYIILMLEGHLIEHISVVQDKLFW